MPAGMNPAARRTAGMNPAARRTAGINPAARFATRVMIVLSDLLGLVGDAVELLAGADEEAAIGDRRGRQYLAAHVIVGKDFELRAVLEHDHEAVLANDEDLAIGRHRRSVVVAEVAEALLLPQRL